MSDETTRYGVGLDRVTSRLPPELAHRLMIRLLPWCRPDVPPSWWRCSVTWDYLRAVPFLLWPIALPWIAARACWDCYRD